MIRAVATQGRAQGNSSGTHQNFHFLETVARESFSRGILRTEISLWNAQRGERVCSTSIIICQPTGDADEIVEKNFFKKLNKIAKIEKFNAIEIIIEHKFLGERIKYGDVYPQRQVRLWKKNHGYFDGKPMDEKIIINKPNIYKSSLKIFDHNLKGLMFWFKKHFKYAKREAQFYFLLKNKKYMKNNFDKALLKKIYYYKYPIFIRPIFLFIYRYFIKKGFLDGVTGLKFNILQTLFYRLLVDFFIIKKV